MDIPRTSYILLFILHISKHMCRIWQCVSVIKRPAKYFHCALETIVTARSLKKEIAQIAFSIIVIRVIFHSTAVIVSNYSVYRPSAAFFSINVHQYDRSTMSPPSFSTISCNSVLPYSKQWDVAERSRCSTWRTSWDVLFHPRLTCHVPLSLSLSFSLYVYFSLHVI